MRSMPGFTAEASLYRLGERYKPAWTNGASEPEVRMKGIVPGAVQMRAPDFNSGGSNGGGAEPIALSLPFYGNHCGPGHGDPTVPAINDVDQCCKTHDRCY